MNLPYWWALIASLTGPAPATTTAPGVPFAGGRLYTAHNLHVGIRPAVYAGNDDVGYGVTLQLTSDWPMVK